MEITVVTPAHPVRMRNGMLARATQSLYLQTQPPAAHAVAVDLTGSGAAATRQRALKMARTPWVAFLDSDDWFGPDHLKELAAHADETGADFVYSWFWVVNPAGQLYQDDPVFPPGHFLNPFDPEDPIETTITTLVRRDLALTVGFQELDRGEANSGEDRRFTLGCLAAGATISHLVKRTWFWHHHGANTSGLPTKGDAIVPLNATSS